MIALSRLLTAAALAVAIPAGLHAQTAEQKGQAIAERAAKAGEGFRDSTAQGEMILYTKSGSQAVRRFTSRTLEGGGPQPTANLVVFDWPGDVRNTALLTHAYDDKADNQWLYLPSVGRVKRISSSAQSGSFMGSEFAYEDMVNQGLDEFSHSWVRDEACPGGGGSCHVLDRKPRRRSGYALQRVWLDQSNYTVHQVQYFDRAGRHVKTLSASGFRKYAGRFWRASRLRMTNHLTGKRTDLNWSGIKFGIGLSARDFSVQALNQLN